MRVLAFAAAMVALIGTAHAQRAPLEAYAGRLPSERVGRSSFIEVVRTLVQPAVGEARWRRLTSYGTSAPIEVADDGEFGRTLIAWQCRAHECTDEATIVVTAAGRLIAVCFSDGTRAEWVGPGWRAPSRETECGWEPAEVFARLRAARARQ